jgi:hypothetical protein
MFAAGFAVAGLDDAELVSVIEFWERAASAAAAAQLAAIASWRGGGRGPMWTVVRPAIRMPGTGWCRRSASSRSTRWRRRCACPGPPREPGCMPRSSSPRLPAVAAALADGLLDMPKVRAVVESVAVLDRVTAVAVTDRVLPRRSQPPDGCRGRGACGWAGPETGCIGSVPFAPVRGHAERPGSTRPRAGRLPVGGARARPPVRRRSRDRVHRTMDELDTGLRRRLG